MGKPVMVFQGLGHSAAIPMKPDMDIILKTPTHYSYWFSTIPHIMAMKKTESVAELVVGSTQTYKESNLSLSFIL